VQELTQWGFAHAPVLMANEAHDGETRCIRTREVGVRMVQAAHEAGVRRLAMEALPLASRRLGGAHPGDHPAGRRRLPGPAGHAPPWVPELLTTLGETLAAHGGTTGILRDQAPPPLNDWPGVDALIVSTDNAFT